MHGRPPASNGVNSLTSLSRKGNPEWVGPEVTDVSRAHSTGFPEAAGMAPWDSPQGTQHLGRQSWEGSVEAVRWRREA